MTLSSEIRRLTQRFTDDYDDRIAAVISIREGTAQKMADFHEAHQNMASEQRRRLTDQMNEFRHSMSMVMSDIEAAHRNMATELHHRLNDLGVARRNMGAEQHRRLTDYMNGVRVHVETVMKDFDAAHQRMAAEQRSRLSSGRAHLASDVSKMRRKTLSDLSDAHKAWSSFSVQMERRRSKKSHAKKPVVETHKAAAKEKPVPSAAEGAAADDLTTIPGIGPTRLQSLNAMGIHTFAQLADSTPERLRQGLTGPAHLVNVEQWIEEARKRTRNL